MAKKHKSQLLLAVLFIFLGVALSINFLHTETNTHQNNNCPACHFQNSTLVTHLINFFHMPQLTVLETLQTSELLPSQQVYFISPSSRSPPQA